jgi:hypothetical protein
MIADRHAWHDVCVGQVVKLRPIGNRRQDTILPHTERGVRQESE